MWRWPSHSFRSRLFDGDVLLPQIPEFDGFLARLCPSPDRIWSLQLKSVNSYSQLHPGFRLQFGQISLNNIVISYSKYESSSCYRWAIPAAIADWELWNSNADARVVALLRTVAGVSGRIFAACPGSCSAVDLLWRGEGQVAWVFLHLNSFQTQNFGESSERVHW